MLRVCAILAARYSGAGRAAVATASAAAACAARPSLYTASAAGVGGAAASSGRAVTYAAVRTFTSSAVTAAAAQPAAAATAAGCGAAGTAAQAAARSSGLRALLRATSPAPLPTFATALAAPARKLLEGHVDDAAAGKGQPTSQPTNGAAFAATTPLEKPSFVGRVVMVYLHTVWGLCKQAMLAILAAVTTGLLFRALPDPGTALLITMFVVLPIYIIAAFESAGSSKEEAAGYAIFSSVLNFLKPTPPNSWATGKKHVVKY